MLSPLFEILNLAACVMKTNPFFFKMRGSIIYGRSMCVCCQHAFPVAAIGSCTESTIIKFCFDLGFRFGHCTDKAYAV